MNDMTRQRAGMPGIVIPKVGRSWPRLGAVGTPKNTTLTIWTTSDLYAIITRRNGRKPTKEMDSTYVVHHTAMSGDSR